MTDPTPKPDAPKLEIIVSPASVAAYDQLAAFFDPRISQTVHAIADAIQLGLSVEDCYVLAIQAIRNFTDEPNLLAAVAALCVVRMSQREVDA
jgi:hypothetical protein